MTITAEAVTGQPFSFKRFRQVLAAMGLQEGVYGAGDFLVRQRAAGANMSVEVDPGDALVTIDSGTRNGAAHVQSDAVENPAVGASHATLPRIDAVVLQYNDTGIPAGVGGNTPTVRVVPGTATAGATLDNRNGAPGGPGGPAFPPDALLLRDVLVPAASTSVTTANTRDRRKRARGLVMRSLSLVNGVIAGPSSSITPSEAASATFTQRMELSGALLRWQIRTMCRNVTNSFGNDLGVWYDGAVYPPANGGGRALVNNGAPAGMSTEHCQGFTMDGIVPGSHLVGLAVASGSASGTYQIESDPNRPSELIVWEDIRPLG